MYICVVRIMRTEIARRTDVNECHFVRRMPCFYMTRKRQRVIRSDLLCLFISCTVFIFSHFHLHGMQDNCPHTPTNTDQLLTNLILTCTLFEHPLPPMYMYECMTDFANLCAQLGCFSFGFAPPSLISYFRKILNFTYIQIKYYIYPYIKRLIPTNIYKIL